MVQFSFNFHKRKLIIIILSICIVLALIAVALILFFVLKVKSDTRAEEEEEHWSYEDQDDWPLVYCRIGQQQSPIALSQQTAYKRDLNPLILENFDQEYVVEIYQNGHTVVVEIPKNCACDRPQLSGAGLTQTYVLQSFHFHWPAEHTLDGLQYDLETHFVFYSTKYNSYEEALKFPFGITVLGVLYLQTNYTQTNNFKIIAEATRNITDRINSRVTPSNTLTLGEFLPSNYQAYYTYEGSFTTPNCLEYVNWIVLKNSSNIQYTYLQDLRQIRDSNGTKVTHNNRTLQPINNRAIFLRS